MTSFRTRFGKACLSLRSAFALFAFAVAALSPAQLRAESLAKLDAIVVEAGSLDRFLASPELIERYYSEAVKYYGGPDKFPRGPYDRIIEQMRVVTEKVPGFAERAFETEGLGKAYAIRASAPTYGRRLEPQAWERYLDKFKAELRAGAGELALLGPADRLARINAILADVDARVAEHKVATEAMNKRERGKAQAAFFKVLREDPALKRASDWLLLEHLESPAARETFETGSADLIINAFRTWKDNPRALLDHTPGLANPEQLATPVKSALPLVDTLLANTELLPVRMLRSPTLLPDGTPGPDKFVPEAAGPAGTWEFKPAPRRFHTFFKGLPFNECVGGSCEYLESTTPERWATAALKDTQLHYIEAGKGSFQGWVQSIPVKVDGHTYAAVEFGSPVFRRSIVESGEHGVHLTSMVSAWLREAGAVKPAAWEGFVVSQSNAANNGGGLPAVRSSPAYLLGEKIKVADHPVGHHDTELAAVIPELFPRVGESEKYGGRMIYDVVVPSVEALTVLRPGEESLRDLLKAAIARGDQAYVRDVLAQMYRGTVGAVPPLMATLRDAGVLHLLADAGFHIPQERMVYTNEPSRYFNQLLDEGFSTTELRDVARLASRGVDRLIEFNRVQARFAKTPAEFLAAVGEARPDLGEDYAKKMAALRASLADRFVGLRPSHDELARLREAGVAADSGGALGRLYSRELAAAGNADELARTLGAPFERLPSAARPALGQVLRERYHHFRSLEPSDELRRRFRAGLALAGATDSGEFRVLGDELERSFRKSLAAAASPAEFTEAVASGLKGADPELRERNLRLVGEARAARFATFSPAPTPADHAALDEAIAPPRKPAAKVVAAAKSVAAAEPVAENGARGGFAHKAVRAGACIVGFGKLAISRLGR